VSDLFSIMSSATRALEAQRMGLDVTSQNIANVNTPGYSRRVVDLAAIPPPTRNEAGGGAEVLAVRSQRDLLVERRLQLETSGAERYGTIADTVATLETAIGTGSSGLDTRLNQFFDSLSRLADRPTDAVARQDVVLQATSLASAFNGTVSRLQDLGRDTDQRVVAAVGEINDLTDRIARLNGTIATSSINGSGLHARDEQQELVKQLAALTDIRVTVRSDGGVDVDSATGRGLVIGSTPYALVASAAGPGGNHQITLGGVDITSDLTGGRLGGLLEVRDTIIPGYIQELDQQAFTLASAVNAAHTAGVDLDGNAGQPFFTFSTPPQGVAGAAAALNVNAAIQANTRLIAAAGSAQPGDNQAARALAAVRDARLMNNGTATAVDAWGQFVARVGRDVQGATAEHELRTQIVGQVESLRDQVSGVSLDEEALSMMKFQRAYEASAKLFRAADDALQVLFDTFSR
jgi:flagellar hook-associated protein 1 FlgK